jgi:hypothetical protein
MNKLIPIILCTFALTAQGAQYVGNPNGGNGWDTTSEVSVRGSTEVAERPWIHAIDGSGIHGAQGQFHTDCLEADCVVDLSHPATMGFAAGNRGMPDRWVGGTQGRYWAEFAFTSAEDITDMHIWNYNEDVGPQDGPDTAGMWSMQGMKEITIYHTTIGNGIDGFGSDTESDWTAMGPITLTRGSGDQHLPVEIVPLNATAQYVLFLGANNSNNNFMSDFGISSTSEEGALSEVRFEIVPEPTTLALVGLGGLAMFLRRRR